jgi:hypothetical protein
MITLSGQRFVGVSQADETRGERSKRVNHAFKQRDTAFSTCTQDIARNVRVRVNTLYPNPNSDLPIGGGASAVRRTADLILKTATIGTDLLRPYCPRK